jgi:hypothetical protein
VSITARAGTGGSTGQRWLIPGSRPPRGSETTQPAGLWRAQLSRLAGTWPLGLARAAFTAGLAVQATRICPAPEPIAAAQLSSWLTQRAIQPWFSTEIAASQASTKAVLPVGVSARASRSCSRRWAVRRNSTIMWS